ncbi:hypothetical protein D0860_02290 [Hortaea werneckii]|uniref:Hpc2-related domain-containing protein n=1 Tax=Hortaea werneckii TaxID=91943 RepID=A0A3M7HLY7_HORWE|nr:hypothetical protein D0860_02290 [Hortaea werneckii]
MNAPPGFAERMAADASEHSSSSLSPPPSPNTIRVAAGSGSTLSGGKSTQSSTLAANINPANATNPNAPPNTAPEKPKRRRKDAGADGNETKPKTTKPRKPREPKATTGTAASRKKQKTEEQSHQQTLTSMVNGSQQAQPTRSAAASPLPQHVNNQPLSASNQPTSRPASNGHTYVRGYDPVRGAMMDAGQYRPTSASTSAQAATASPQVNRASASPSIASLIDPPAASAKTSAPNLPYSSQANMQQQQSSFAHSPHSQQRSPEPLNTLPAPLAAPSQISTKSPQPMEDVKPKAVPNMDGAMDVDVISCEAQAPTKSLQPPQPEPNKLAASKSSSSGPTPKPTRPTPPPAPKGTGSGLLSGHDLFGGTTSSKDNKPDGNPRGVNIDIRIPLNPMGGNTINIAQEIAKKYGRDAINPRAAAHREQLLKVQAAANRLEGAEGGSALDDTMSVDLSDGPGGAGGDDGSNVEMGGMGGAGEEAGSDNNNTNNKPKQRQRKKKVEEYDKEDDFIDDTELAWQEQAAVSKDGFFVYSGPLIPEGQTANVESASQLTSGRGRGRGRGRGSRGGAAAASAADTTHASLAAEKKDRDPNAPSPAPRARGRGRGTGAPRKPRVTKADRERMEVEKAERERAAANAANAGGVGNHVRAPALSGGAAGLHGGLQHQQQQAFNGPTGGTICG